MWWKPGWLRATVLGGQLMANSSGGSWNPRCWMDMRLAGDIEGQVTSLCRKLWPVLSKQISLGQGIAEAEGWIWHCQLENDFTFLTTASGRNLLLWVQSEQIPLESSSRAGADTCITWPHFSNQATKTSCQDGVFCFYWNCSSCHLAVKCPYLHMKLIGGKKTARNWYTWIQSLKSSLNRKRWTMCMLISSDQFLVTYM